MLPDRMSVVAALQVLAVRRTREIVVTTMGAVREWSRLSNSPLDFHYLPSAMGHAPMIALGLALARPDYEVITINGDGSQLMDLGGLVTIAACRPKNLSVILLDNGVYEVTGGQSTPGARASVDYATIARGAGFPTAVSHHDLPLWESAAATFFASPAPRFLALRVHPVTDDFVPKLAAGIAERMEQLRAAIEQHG